MATLLPPPKRQKQYYGVPEPEKAPPVSSPNVIVQFVSEDDGSALAPAVSLPANVSREDLQSLVNTLTSKVCSIQPFSLHVLSTSDILRPKNPCPFNSMSRYQLMP
jgi:ribosome assembly protein 4